MFSLSSMSCGVMFQNKFSREMLIDHNFEGREDGSCVVCKYMPAPVYVTEDGLRYTVNDAQECRIVGHEGEPVTLEIPEEIEGKAVTSIKDNAFIGCMSLETLAIPGSVKEVGEWAFHGCENLSSVTLEYGIETLNSDVFSGCPLLSEIVLPDSITTMRNGVFSRCYGLESVTLSKGLTVLDEGIFWENTSLKSIEIPDGVTTIVDNCFIMSGLESITIPASVESIAESAFAGCESLATVYTPSGSYAEEFFAEYYREVEILP